MKNDFQIEKKMKMRYPFRIIYCLKLEHFKREKKLSLAKKLIKLNKNTYGIQQNDMMSIIYSHLGDYYKE